MACPKDGLDGVCNLGDLFGWQLHGSVEAIKDPSQNLLAGGPDSFSLSDQLLVGDGVLTSVSSGIWWREDLVDCMEECSAVVA